MYLQPFLIIQQNKLSYKTPFPTYCFIFFALLTEKEMPKRVVDENTSETGSNKRRKKEVRGEGKKIEGTAVLMRKKNIFEKILDLGGVSLQLVSAVNDDPGKLGKPANLQKSEEGESVFKITFDWEEEIGVPGAVIIKNTHQSKFLLKTFKLDVPEHGLIHFVCNSWVYPEKKYHYDRIFFTNQAYLPSQTPVPLQWYRKKELEYLRGNGTGKLKKWDRVYDYAYYNDLGNPKKGPEYVRPVLGGSPEYPYPRRGRTGRAASKKDPNSEERLPLVDSLNIYVPRDERFDHSKLLDSLSSGAKAIVHFLSKELEGLCDHTPNEFDTFQQVLRLYGRDVELRDGPLLNTTSEPIPCKYFKKLVKTVGEQLNFPVPQVIDADTLAWRSDEEFAREMLAGVNPVVIRCLEKFPPESKLNQKAYGNQNSKITEEDIEKNLDGLTIKQAMENKKLFILDHHDTFMPYLRGINNNEHIKTYATRTVLFLKDDGTLKPLAIELSLPDLKGDNIIGAISEVCIPAEHGVKGSIWQLAKAYVAVNDSGYHQLISHWLNTHAVIEPFVIATNRQLSVVHPIYKLLHPHFRDTMNINALARQILINAGGLLEHTVFPAKYSMEMSAAVYKDWVFTDQALPNDLKKRGMVVEDPESNSRHGLHLLIKDYPYAVDGLEIWSAIETWVQDYCNFYYKTDVMVRNDQELQLWWKELREEGHGDKKDATWWPKMQNVEELIETCTIIIWVASALHAAVNFGQYPYAGYLPNRPTISRQLLPKKGSEDYNKLNSEFAKVFFKTITSQLQTLIGISLIEILSTHSSDEVYLGQRALGWTLDEEPLQAFEKFRDELKKIENRIMERNRDEKLKNRVGPVKMKYTLLCPSSESGLTGKGIPNSVSI